MHGTPDIVREQASLAMGELIAASPEAGLKPTNHMSFDSYCRRPVTLAWRRLVKATILATTGALGNVEVCLNLFAKCALVGTVSGNLFA